MANRFLNNIRINDAYTFPASDGNDGQVITTDGAGNLAFENVSPDAASVIYRDNFTGDGSTVTFDLQNSITDEDQTQIYIDGVYQEKSTYSISGTTITFTTAPILGHSVEVISISSINTGPTVLYQDNFTGNGNDTAFTLGQEIDNEIKTFIFLNGVYQFKNTYTVDGATLTFDTAPANGVAIEVVSIASAVQTDSLEAGAVIIPVKNTHTASISKGTPVYITGNVGASERLQIAPADASNSAKMPAAGLLLTTLAVNAEGYVITGGYLRNLTTDTIDGTSTSSNDTVYVKAGGGLTMTKPTGSNLIQNIAKVARSASGNSGSLLVSSILRTNDIPNLTTGKIWVGSANNTIESGTLHLDESNNRLGINNNNPSYSLDVTGDANISSNVIVGGNLTVQGTETILNTQTVEVEDNILQLNTTQGSPDTATATTSGISIYRGSGVTQASFIFDDADDTWDLTDSLFVANNIDTAADKRISVGAWDNSAFTGGNAYGFSVTSSLPLLHLTESDQTNKKGYVGLSGGSMYIGGLISNLYLQTGTSGTTALTLDSSQNAIFAGNVGVGGKTPTYGLNLAQGTGTSSKIAWTDGTPDFAASIYANSSTDKLTFATKNASNVETTALEIDISQNATFAGKIIANKNVALPDSSGGAIGRVTFGASEDLQIYHDGSSSNIVDEGTGTLFIKTNTLKIRNVAGSEDYAEFFENGAVNLYYDNSLRLKTTSGGVNIINDVQISDGVTRLISNQIQAGYNQNVDNTDIWINYQGYQGGTTYYRDFRVGNGKQGEIAHFDGSTSNVTFTGNVGIGQSPSTAKLEVAGEARVYTGSNLGYWGVDSGNSYVYFGTNSSGYSLSFQTAGSERMRIDSSGNVGIKNTSPSDFDTWQRQLVVGNGTADAGITIYHGSGGGNQGAIAFADGNTGTDRYRGIISYNGADEMKFFTSTAERMRIDSSGNVGIGVVPESTWYAGGQTRALQIGGTVSIFNLFDTRSVFANNYYLTTDGSDTYINTDEATQYYQEAGQHIWKHALSGTADTTITWSESMRIDSSGNVGINTDDPQAKLEVKQNGNNTRFNSADANGPYITFSNNGTPKGYIGSAYHLFSPTPPDGDDLGIRAENDLIFSAGGATERMRIDSSGRVCIDDVINTSTKFNIYNNNSSLTYALGIESTQYAGTHAWFRGSAGTTGTISYSGTSTSYNTSSDYRLKENVVEMTGALDRVSQLKPSRFNFISDADKIVDGFLAHEVQEIVPEAITGTKDEVDEEGNPVYQGIDQSKLVPLLVGAIKELKAEVETLKNQINGIN